MAQPSSDKFNELAPVLELMYVVMTHMTRYLDVYANDIDAAKLEEFKVAKSAMEDAIKKFNTFFGVEADDAVENEEEVMSEVEEQTESPIPQPKTDVAPVPSSQQPVATFVTDEDEEDQEALKKAKQAVDELKALFAEMKEKDDASTVSAAAPSVEQQSMAPVMQQTAPSQYIAPPPPPPAAPSMVVPTPENTQQQMQQAGDASEIDSILAELRKLQNKGGQL